MAVSLVYSVLIIWDFKLSETIYDKFLFEILMANEKGFHKFFKYIHQIMENTIYAFLRACRDIVFAFLNGLIPMLPDMLKMPLHMMGVTTYLESKVNTSIEDKKKKEKEYLEYAKKIEKNRPTSPSKTGDQKIDLSNFEAKKSGDQAQTKQGTDSQDKQFKIVPNGSSKQQDDTKLATNTKKLHVPDQKSGS